jgi:hypothetical protein
MCFCRKTVLTSIVLMIGFLSMCEIIRGQQQGRMVQATFADRTDSQGFRWDINQNGQIGSGTNYSFSQALSLSVNNQSFNIPSNQATMAAGGDEYVLNGKIQNLDVTRRIKIDLKGAIVQYVEVFRNPTPSPIITNVKLTTQLNQGPLQTMTTDSGAPFSSVLGPKDEGLIGLAHPGQGQISVLLYLAEAKSRVKPTIQNQSNYRIDINYAITVPAGKTVAIMHGMAQRNLNSVPDPKTAADLFKPFRSRSWMRNLPEDIQRSLLNVSGSQMGGGSDDVSVLSVKALDVETGPADVMAVGDRTRLHGTAACGKLSVKTRFGAYTAPFDKVAAIVGDQCSCGGSRVFLRDGQILAGPLELTDLRFTMDTGSELHLSAENLDRLVLHQTERDGQPADDVFALLETASGDRLALTGNQNSPLAATTPWGELNVPLNEILSVSADPEQLGYWLRLKDGSRLFSFLSSPTLSIQTQIFGVQKFNVRQIRSLVAAHINDSEAKKQGEISMPHLLLAGENVFVGRVDRKDIHFLLAGQKVPVSSNQLRVMRNLSDKGETNGLAPTFEAELWDSGKVRGTLEELVLPIRSADRVYSVRVQDIEEIHAPAPAAPDAVRTKIAQFIQDLGDPDFAKREAAGKSLADIGYLAKSQLNETLNQTNDPEVRRRVQKLLENLSD